MHIRLDARSKRKLERAATDWDAFHEALLNPPAPNAALKGPPAAAVNASVDEPPHQEQENGDLTW